MVTTKSPPGRSIRPLLLLALVSCGFGERDVARLEAVLGPELSGPLAECYVGANSRLTYRKHGCLLDDGDIAGVVTVNSRCQSRLDEVFGEPCEVLNPEAELAAQRCDAPNGRYSGRGYGALGFVYRVSETEFVVFGSIE